MPVRGARAGGKDMQPAHILLWRLRRRRIVGHLDFLESENIFYDMIFI